MSTTITSARTVALEQIHTPENVRVLDAAHVKALAGSIELQGVLVPLVVRERDEGFELVAGFHRMAAATSLSLAEVPVVIRAVDSEDADRAVENIARKQLNPTRRPRRSGQCSVAASARTARRRPSAGRRPGSPPA
jgi:ParB/RepB/Spo0J family partition protein